MPEEIWIKLKAKTVNSRLTRASLVASVAHSIGLECPDQPTLYRMVSVLAYCEDNFQMPQADVHQMMDKMQSFIKGHVRAPEYPYLEHHPCNAQGLPKVIQDKAYGSSDLPVEVEIPELNMVLGDNKMRGRKKDQGPEWLQHVPEAFRGMVLAQVVAASKKGSGSSSSDHGSPAATPAPLPSSHLLRGLNRGAGTKVTGAQLAETKGEPRGHEQELVTKPAEPAALPPPHRGDTSTEQAHDKCQGNSGRCIW